MTLKTLSFLAFLFLLIPAWGYGQSSWPPPLILTSAPTGSCANGVQAVDIIAKTFYYCAGNVWNLTAGGGGSGTVNSGTANQLAYYATTGTAVSGDSLLTDNGAILKYTGTGGLQVGNPGTFTMTYGANASMTGNVSFLGPASQPASGILSLDASGNWTTVKRNWSCQTGLGDGLNAITSGTYLQTFCYNDTGSTVTITGIRCFADAGTPTLNATDDLSNGLLTGAVTCTTSFAAGTQSATTTIANNGYIKFTFVAGGTAKQTTWEVKGTY